jgi:uncharacterized protein (TIGR02145 family)
MKCNFLLSLLICILSHALLFSQELKHVAIGNQTWMSENLSVDKFRNGDKIPEAKTAEEWESFGKLGQAAWCYYGFDSKNESIYGKLYNWYAVNDSRKISPTGWHVPTNLEWKTLMDFLGGDAIAGVKMKSITGWNFDGNGSNSSKFSGNPGGNVNWQGEFLNIGTFGHWWSITENSEFGAWEISLSFSFTGVNNSAGGKGCGYSVRLLKGELPTIGEAGDF